MLLDKRECGCLVIDKRRLRRCCYMCLGTLLIAAFLYGLLLVVTAGDGIAAL